MLISRENSITHLVYSIILVLFFSTMYNAFFWDTVQLGSSHATFYYNTSFSKFLLPNYIDSGHIPFFGMYIAFIWKILGRNLLVSHLAMLPFILGIVWQLKILIDYFFDTKHVGVVLLLVILDPTLLAQTTLVSPDIFLVFFFILSLNAIMKNNKKLLLTGIVFLFLTSMRGMMVAFILLLIDIFYTINFSNKKIIIFKSLIQRSLIYLPALVIFVAFSIYHYKSTGWIGYHKDSPWASSFEAVDWKGFIFNIGILGWRIVDFGRIGVWLIFIFLFLKYFKVLQQHKKIKFLFIITLLFITLLPLNMLWAKGLLQHRYLLPIYLLFSLLTAKILFKIVKNSKTRTIIIAFWITSIISGNFWIYPDKIAQGWDATLAHLPYYQLRKKAFVYLEQKHINIADVGTFFPNDATIDAIDLNDNEQIFDGYDIGDKFVFYSNIYNIDDTTYDRLATDYKLLKEFKSNGVFIRILEKKQLLTNNL